MLTSVNKLSVLLTFPFLARYFSVEEYVIRFSYKFDKFDNCYNCFWSTCYWKVYTGTKKLEAKKVIITNSFYPFGIIDTDNFNFIIL